VVPAVEVTVVARKLSHPFALALLPDGDALISERGGALRLLRNALGAPGRPTLLEPQPVAGLPAVTEPYRNAGLQDVVLHPRFAQNRLVYFTFNEPGDAAPATTGRPGFRHSRLTIQRGRYEGGALRDVQKLFTGLSAATSGSRITFGADGMLYATIGAPMGDGAQQLDNTVGKVLRLTETGEAAPGNPFAGRAGAHPAIFSLGHRDPLGLGVHPGTGALLLTEHGPNGGDELNVIESGGNYGWPRITYGHGYDGAPMGEGPVASDVKAPLVVWQPSIGITGVMVYTGERFPAWKGNVFVGSVRRGQVVGTGGLERIEFNDKMQELRRETLFTSLRQRVRDVRQGADGLIYVLTDEDDGALLRLSPAGASTP
jgi:glucose/arabinose dehydrogenase